MIRYSIFIVLILCVLPFVPACAGKPAQTAAGAPAPQAAKPAGEDPVVAKVLGNNITEKQVLNAINQIAQQRRLQPQEMQQRDVLLFKEAVDSLIGVALLRNEARSQKLTVEKAKIDETYKGIAKEFSSEADFKKVMELQGMTETSLRTAIEENLLGQQVLDGALKGLSSPTDAEVKKFYDDNPNFFNRPEQAHAAHILLQVPAGATPESKAEIKQKIEAIRVDIESKKITFAEAAAKYSQDKSNASNGGDLGFFPRGRMVKPFEDAAFGSKPGTLTPVIETQFGYHIVSVMESKPAGKATLEEAKSNIQNYLSGQAKQAAVQKYIGELRAKVPVEMVMTEEQWKQRRNVK